MKCPKWLFENEHARKFWQDHAKHLIEDGTLTDKNLESFALLCQVWGNIQSAQRNADDIRERSCERMWYTSQSKLFVAMSKQFKSNDKMMNIADIINEGMKDAGEGDEVA